MPARHGKRDGGGRWRTRGAAPTRPYFAAVLSSPWVNPLSRSSDVRLPAAMSVCAAGGCTTCHPLDTGSAPRPRVLFVWLGNVELPQSLVEAHQAGELVIFVGAGASIAPPSGLPSFEDLTSWICRDFYFGQDFPASFPIRSSARAVRCSSRIRAHPRTGRSVCERLRYRCVRASTGNVWILIPRLQVSKIHRRRCCRSCRHCSGLGWCKH